MTLSNLGVLLKHLDKTREAEELYREALTVFTRLADDDPTHPEHHHDMAGTMVNLAIILFDRKDFLGARRLLDEALPRHQAALKANKRHPAYRTFFRYNRRKLAQTLL